MALATLALKTTFQFGGAPKKFEFVDESDVVSQGVALVNATGVLKIEDPLNNTLYNNTDHGTPDIDFDVSLTNLIDIFLPLDGSGNPLQGEYTFTYTVQDSAGAGAPDEVILVKKFTLAYASPKIDLLLTADCVQPLLLSTDNTGYTVNSVTPIIIRDHKILYPPSVNQPDVTGTGPTLPTAVFFTIKGSTLQHTSTLTSTLTYDFSDNFFVTDTISGQDVNDVACEGQLCDIYCCVRSEWNRYIKFLNVNDEAAQEHLTNWIQMTSLMEKIRVALECGKGNDVSEYVARIQVLGQCEEGCDCDDGTPQLVTGLGGGTGTVVVDTGGAPVVVNSVVNGDITTYTITLDPTFVTKVNNSFNTEVLAGTDITVDLVITPNGTKRYTVNATQAPIVNILSFLVEIDLTPGALPVVTDTDHSIQGPAFSISNVIVSNENTAQGNYLNQNTDFLINEVWATQGSLKFKPDVHIIDKIIDPDVSANPANISLEMFDSNPTNISFRFIDSNGSIVTGNVLNGYDKIKLQVTLTA